MTSKSSFDFFHQCNLTLYTAARDCFFICKNQKKHYKWCKDNHRQLTSPPIYWFKSNKFVKKFFPHHLDLLQDHQKNHLLSHQSLKGYFKKEFKKGTCFGECMALIEQLLQNPFNDPLELLKKVKRNYDRVMFFQVLEIIRGTSPEQNDPACYGKYPATPSIHQTGLTDALVQLNPVVMKGVFLIRYQNDKDHFVHSSVYADFNHHFWFYDIYDGGLYTYNSSSHLHEQFMKHMQIFFPQSEDTFLTIERFLTG